MNFKAKFIVRVQKLLNAAWSIICSLFITTLYKMRRSILVLVLALSTSVLCAQVQVGVFGGISNYQGDLEDQVFRGQLTKPAFGLLAKYELTNRVLLRGGLTFAKVAADDRYSENESLRRRNLSFQSNIVEVSAVAEVHTFRFYEKRWSPYVFGGLALYHFNPYTFDADSNKVFLQPLTTEGQGLDGYSARPYSLTQLALPFGGGIRFDVTDRIVLGAEIGLRKLFTDYLDDVSTNYAGQDDLFAARGQQAVDLAYRGDEVPGGNPFYPEKGAQRGGAKLKDWYYFTGLSLSFRLGGGSGAGFGNGGSKRTKTGCPPNPM